MQAEKSAGDEEEAATKNMASAKERAAVELAKENEIVEAARQAYRKALGEADVAQVRLCACVCGDISPRTGSLSTIVDIYIAINTHTHMTIASRVALSLWGGGRVLLKIVDISPCDGETGRAHSKLLTQHAC